MKYVKPKYYDDFKCKADKCPSTCCAGWQIMIDDETLDKYSLEGGEFGYKLKNAVDWEEGVFIQKGGKCVLLNKDNLCSLVIAKGEEYLCNACHIYPRHIEEFEGVREFSLSLSCPVAAEMILSQTDRLTFITEENDLEDPLQDEFEDFDRDMYVQLLQIRENLFDIIQNREISVDMRMAYIMDIAEILQKAVNNQQKMKINISDIISKTTLIEDKYQNMKAAYEILMELEMLREDWPKFLGEFKANLHNSTSDNYYAIREEFYADFVEMLSLDRWEIFKEQLLMFWVYTYFCGAVYDDCVYSKLALAVFSVRVIEEMIISRWLGNNKKMTFEECMEICYRYAREIEHSDENLNLLEEILDNGEV